MLRSLLIAASLWLVTGTSVAADTALPVDVFANAGFKITLASGANATKQEGPDFFVYYVKWGAAGQLGLYEGCCAQAFLTGADVVKTDITINGLKAHEAKRDADGNASREVHITVTRPGSSASFIVHAWYKNLGADDAKIADQMIATIAAK